MKDYKLNFYMPSVNRYVVLYFGYVIRNQIYSLLNFYVFILLTVILYVSKSYGFYADNYVMELLSGWVNNVCY